MAGRWQRESFLNQVTQQGVSVTTAAPTGFSVVDEFQDPGVGNSLPMYFPLDLPATVQVGVIGHAWGAPYETQAEYDCVRFAATPPASLADCTALAP